MIEVTNVTKEFKKTIKEPGLKGSVKSLFHKKVETVKAVDDISFSVAEGEILGFIGPNGAGKSTAIKMLTGILTPSSGEIVINGQVPYKNRKKYVKEIGVVFGQRTQLWWDLPLSESFTILKEIYNVSDADYEERMKFLNNVLELQEFFDRPVRTLSLGQRMRADLGAALLHNPKVLYLDEPTIGLDLVVKDNIRQAIKEINEKYQTTVILTTHDIGDIEELCSRIIMIDEGKKIYDGSLEKLKDTYGTTRKISMEVRKLDQFKELRLAEKLGVSEEECRMELEKDKSVLTVTFDKHKVMVPQIMNAVMEVSEVKDIQIQETELAEIVKQIYNHGCDAELQS